MDSVHTGPAFPESELFFRETVFPDQESLKPQASFSHPIDILVYTTRHPLEVCCPCSAGSTSASSSLRRTSTWRLVGESPRMPRSPFWRSRLAPRRYPAVYLPWAFESEEYFAPNNAEISVLSLERLYVWKQFPHNVLDSIGIIQARGRSSWNRLFFMPRLKAAFSPSHASCSIASPFERVNSCYAARYSRRRVANWSFHQYIEPLVCLHLRRGIEQSPAATTSCLAECTVASNWPGSMTLVSSRCIEVFPCLFVLCSRRGSFLCRSYPYIKPL